MPNPKTNIDFGVPRTKNTSIQSDNYPNIDYIRLIFAAFIHHCTHRCHVNVFSSRNTTEQYFQTYTLVVYITFYTGPGVHVPISQLYCVMAVVLTVG